MAEIKTAFAFQPETQLTSPDPALPEGATVYSEHSGAWIRSVIGLLDVAGRQLEHSRDDAQSTIGQATLLLNEQIRPPPRESVRVPGGLLAWQARKVRDYVEAHIASRVLVSDLGAILQLSQAHFARSFKQTFGISPHAFVIRRRLERAARLMLESSASLADIAPRCGFADQSHLCRQFRRSIGESPAVWRRARRG